MGGFEGDELRRYPYTYRAYVKANDDPLKIGRVQVTVPAIFGPDIVTDWVSPETPFPAGAGIGIFIPPALESQVWVQFENGDPQLPIYSGGWIGAVGSISDLPPTALGTVDESAQNKGIDSFTTPTGGDRDEPPGPFAAEYPNNLVLKTAAGHVVELDGTPGAERIQIFHAAGAFIEIHPDGRMMLRAKAGMYRVVEGDDDQHIEGDAHVKADGAMHLDAAGGINLGGPIEVARVGDTVAVGGGSSAGGWPIVTGSGKVSAG